MKRSLIMACSALLACSSMAMASSRYDQQTTERPRRVELPGFLGVEIGEVSGETVTRLKLREERGALIEGVTSGSSAAQAGLQKNDVIIRWDGEPIESAREMSRLIRETPPGRAVRLTVMRDGREMEVTVTLGERAGIANRVRVVRPTLARLRVRPDVVWRARERSNLGVQLQSMTPQLAEYFGLSKRSGALVIFVFADSPAAKAGLKAGDVILSADSETVENPLDVRRVLSGKSEGVVEFRILREKKEQTLRVQLEKGTSSWLLTPDDAFDDFDLAISPLTIHIPKVAIAPKVVRVPAISLKPMKIEMPELKLAPIEIPNIKLDPIKIEIPKVDIKPMKVLIVPRRIVL